tara:strand:- start:4666 stop:4926 length:261 start_codon:yes stop_codon:yes gene_type:complete
MKNLNKFFEAFSILIVLFFIGLSFSVSKKVNKNDDFELKKCIEIVENAKKEAYKTYSENEYIPKIFNSGIDYVYNESIKQCKDKFR